MKSFSEVWATLRKDSLLLIGIFLFAVAFRLVFALQTAEFSSPESYFTLRQVESIRETGLPLFEDRLSYGGRSQVFLPLYYYLLAGASFLFPAMIAFKVVPSVLASAIVIVTYLVCKDLTKNREASLFAALLSAFMPVFVTETTNTLSNAALSVPLAFLVLYLFQLLSKDQKPVPWLLLCLFMLSLLDMSIFLVIGGLLFYLLLLRMEKMEVSRAETEIALFATFFVMWLTLTLFKKVLLAHGPTVVWQNIPPQLLDEFFLHFNLLEAVSLIGLLPFIMGLYAGYTHIVVERKRVMFLFLGFALATFILLGMRLIPLAVGLIYLGITLVFLAGQGYKMLLVTIARSKFEPYGGWIRTGMLFVVLLTAVLPSASHALANLSRTPSPEELAALAWLRENTPRDAVVLSTLEEGHYITSIAQRRNIMDSNFILVKDAADRLEDIEIVFTTNSQTEAIRLLSKYDADYVYLAGARESYGIASLPTLDGRCLVEVYPANVTEEIHQQSPVIVERRCALQVSG